MVYNPKLKTIPKNEKKKFIYFDLLFSENSPYNYFQA